MAMTIERFNGRISIIGQGGQFKILEGIEQKVVESIAKKDAAKAKMQPSIPKRFGKIRAFRQFDYTKKGTSNARKMRNRR